MHSHAFYQDENAAPTMNSKALPSRNLNGGVVKQTQATFSSIRAPLSNISNVQYTLHAHQAVAKQVQTQQRSLPAPVCTNLTTEQKPTFFQTPNAPTFDLDWSQMEQKNSSMLKSPGIDRLYEDDPQHVSSYCEDIMDHFKQIESRYLPDANYMERQQDISPFMRAILIDWLVDVHLKLRFQPETLYLAVNIVDRFLDVKQVSRDKLQLCGVTAMLIAAKYEEVFAHEINEYVRLSADSCSKDQIIRMERVMLSHLNFNVTVATVFPFLRRYLKCGQCNTRTQFMANYLCELVQQEIEMLQFQPSVLACAAIYIGNKIESALNNTPSIGWTYDLEYYSGYVVEDIQECVNFMVKVAKETSERVKNIAVRQKYCSETRKQVAKYVARAVASMNF
ncbi:hypothetical protein AKO1_008041 [Acrasis kona]|uniref:Cyclin N-terminal domain-containing protein n=1 Tax=Acrasis kona TaxID=1008807 RepID=A0AAW2YPV0_9EUKA